MAIRMLEDESNVVRLAALETLRDVEFEEKIKVISPLLGSEDRAVRREVIEQIAALSYNRYLNSFDRLDRDKQAEAAKILSKLDEHLAEKLSGELSSLDPVKRLKALKIIQLTEKGPELSNVLEELLADPDLRVRATAIRLVQFGKSISAIATLMDLLGDVDGRVRANAVEAIEELGDKRFAPAIERLVNDRDNRCRANAIKCLWSLGGRDKAESALREMLGHEDQNMRLSAVWVISEVKYEPWMELLLERLEKETSPHIRKRIKDFLLSSPGWVL
jgi:HEAT repeat protein